MHEQDTTADLILLQPTVEKGQPSTGHLHVSLHGLPVQCEATYACIILVLIWINQIAVYIDCDAILSFVATWCSCDSLESFGARNEVSLLLIL